MSFLSSLRHCAECSIIGGMNSIIDEDWEGIADASKKHIPSLPVVAVKALRILHEELSNSDDLAQVISFDPSFASRLLTVANAPYFRRGGSVTSVDEAILRLGFGAVSDIVVMSALKDLRRDADMVDFGLWEHSIAVAVASKLIAEQLGAGKPTTLFILGLLHDIGKMIMNINFKEQYKEVISEVTSSGKPFEEVEFSAFGFTHCGMGDYAAKRWGLPAEIRSAIALHHCAAPELADRSDIADVLLVKAADYICSGLRIGIYDNFGPMDKDLEYIGLTGADRVGSLEAKVKEELPKYRSFMLGE